MILHIPSVSQTRLKPSPRLKCNSELFELKENCTDLSKYIGAFGLSQDAHQ